MAEGNNGRQSRARVALVLVAAIVASLLYGWLSWLLPAMTLAVGIVAAREIHNMAIHKGVKSSLPVTMPATAVLIAAGMLPPDRYVAWILPLLVVLLLTVFTVKVFYARLANSLLAIPINLFVPLYIGLPLGLGLQVLAVDRLYLMMVLLNVWALDSAAFFIGCKLGRHKMAPGISPKKSWEGAAGGFVACIAVGVGLKGLERLFGGDMDLTWLEVAGAGVLIGIVGQIGDLAESLIKRDAGVKDSGGAFAGHGGVLDRLDSVLFSFAAFYVYLFAVGRLPVQVMMGAE